jgi:hypothetical protein
MEDIKADKVVPMNIIFPLRGEGAKREVLLGIKTRKIGVGLFNGYGGKVEGADTMTQSAAKELLKESGLGANPADFEKVAVVDFYIHKNDDTIVLNKCDIFFITKFVGEPKATAEMKNPTWYLVSDLPLQQMMPDARFWIPLILNGDRIHVQIQYNEERTKIVGAIHSEQLAEN